MTYHYGLESPRPIMNATKCPKCDISLLCCPEEGVQQFRCGTIYQDGHLDSQSEFCFKHSNSVRRRAGTICGILNSGDRLEMEGMLELVVQHLAKLDPSLLEILKVKVL